MAVRAIVRQGSLHCHTLPLVILLSLGCKLLISSPKWDHQFPKAREGLANTRSVCISSLPVSAPSTLLAPGRHAGLRVQTALGLGFEAVSS